MRADDSLPKTWVFIVGTALISVSVLALWVLQAVGGSVGRASPHCDRNVGHPGPSPGSEVRPDSHTCIERLPARPGLEPERGL